MAYAFNNDKSKVDVLPKSHFDHTVVVNSRRIRNDGILIYAKRIGDVVFAKVQAETGIIGTGDFTIPNTESTLPKGDTPGTAVNAWKDPTCSLEFYNTGMNISINNPQHAIVYFYFSYPLHPDAL